MMLYPPMNVLAEKAGSRYLLVNLVARRARNIAAAVEERCMTAAFRSCTRNNPFRRAVPA